MNNEEIKILIDKYMLGELDTNEISELKDQLKENPKLENQFRQDVDIVQSVKYATNVEHKSILNDIHEEEFGDSKSSWHRINIIIGILLLIGVLGLFVFVDFNKTIQPTHELYAVYYQPYKTTFQIRGDGYELIKNIKEAYLSEDYNSVLKFSNSLELDNNHELKLLYGISAMELDDDVKAHGFFDEIIDSGNYFFTDHARWYKSMLYLKSDNLPEAKLILKLLAADNEADHHSEAKAILKNID